MLFGVLFSHYACSEGAKIAFRVFSTHRVFRCIRASL